MDMEVEARIQIIKELYRLLMVIITLDIFLALRSIFTCIVMKTEMNKEENKDGDHRLLFLWMYLEKEN